jgi:hypothetical protein
MKRVSAIVCSFILPLLAQNPVPGAASAQAPKSTNQIRPRVDPANAYERIFAIVPIVGAGTVQDPKRPLYAPIASALDPVSRSGILGYHFVASDDGLLALVEFVATDRSQFKTILSDSTIQTFVRGNTDFAAIQTAFQLLKKDFNINNFRIRVM